jgi:hypothetical protein
LKIIEFGWMDHHQWKDESRNKRKSYYLVSSTCKTFICKALITKLFEGGYYDMTQRGAFMGLNICDMSSRWVYMGSNVYVIAFNLIKWPHVQFVNKYI